MRFGFLSFVAIMVALAVTNFFFPFYPPKVVAAEPSPAAVFGECMDQKDPLKRAKCAEEKLPTWSLAATNPILKVFNFE